MRKETPATEEQMAAMDFKPWTHTPDEWEPPTNAEWAKLANPYLVTIRMAWLIMFKSKPEVIQVVASLGEEAGAELMSNFIGTIRFFEFTLAILRSAEARILCAGSAHNISVADEPQD